MKKNNIGIILIISILISFISGALGSIIIYGTNNTTTSSPIIKPNNGIILNEKDSISSGVESIYDAVVVVEGFNGGQLASTGTGFIYKESNGKAYIMTNHHVISGVESVKIILSDNSVVDAKVMGSEAYSDIAVLSVNSNKIKSIAIMGDSNKLNVGDTLFTVGSPEGANYAGTVTKGILSGKDRLVAVALSSSTSSSDYYMKVLQTDAAINPGNSGGPICNINGEVIGITNMKLVDATVEGMGFAIPIEDALFYASTLEKGQSVVRPYIGIGMLDITDEYVLWQNGITIGEHINNGIAILEVASNSPADKAKLKKGDVIISVSGEKIESIAEFRYVLYKHLPGDTIEVEYIRGKDTKKVEVKLGENKNQ